MSAPVWDRESDDRRRRQQQAQQQQQALVTASRAAPPYGHRKGWLPRSQDVSCLSCNHSIIVSVWNLFGILSFIYIILYTVNCCFNKLLKGKRVMLYRKICYVWRIQIFLYITNFVVWAKSTIFPTIPVFNSGKQEAWWGTKVQKGRCLQMGILDWAVCITHCCWPTCMYVWSAHRKTEPCTYLLSLFVKSLHVPD